VHSRRRRTVAPDQGNGPCPALITDMLVASTPSSPPQVPSLFLPGTRIVLSSLPPTPSGSLAASGTVAGSVTVTILATASRSGTASPAVSPFTASDTPSPSPLSSTRRERESTHMESDMGGLPSCDGARNSTDLLERERRYEESFGDTRCLPSNLKLPAACAPHGSAVACYESTCVFRNVCVRGEIKSFFHIQPNIFPFIEYASPTLPAYDDFPRVFVVNGFGNRDLSSSLFVPAFITHHMASSSEERVFRRGITVLAVATMALKTLGTTCKTPGIAFMHCYLSAWGPFSRMGGAGPLSPPTFFSLAIATRTTIGRLVDT
jgi:hypothetical protein